MYDSGVKERLTIAACLPADRERATLLARVFVPELGGPSPALVRDDALFDLSSLSPTVQGLVELADPVAAIRRRGNAAAARRSTATCSPIPRSDGRDHARPWLLAPCDLQAIKASGVTFVVEHARARDRGAGARRSGQGGSGAARRSSRSSATTSSRDASGLARGGAAEGRADRAGRVVAVSRSRHRARRRDLHQVAADVGGRARAPRSASTRSRSGTIPSRRSCWSSTAAAARSARRSATTSTCATSRGAARCCSARRRTTTRPARSARSSGSSTTHFGIDDVRRCELAMRVDGPDGFALDGASSMAMISRDPLDLVAQAIGANHQYPDGFDAVPRHDVRADEGSRMRPGRASRTWSATSSPCRRRRSARSSTASTIPTGSRRGRSASAR